MGVRARHKADVEKRATLTRAQPAAPRVLVVATDRRFRAVASTLLTQRGCEVSVQAPRGDIRAQASRERVDVVVIDATEGARTRGGDV